MSKPANVCGGRVRKLRVAMGLTHRELSLLVAARGERLSAGQIEMIEARVRKVRDYELLALAKALRTTVGALVGRGG